MKKRAIRPITLVVLVMFVSACASRAPMNRGEVFAATDIRYTLVIHKHDGNTLTTNNASVGDSTLTVRTLITEGRERSVDPIVIKWSDVESFERVELSNGKTFILLTSIAAIIVTGALIAASAGNPDSS
jgi:hypothetical protein